MSIGLFNKLLSLAGLRDDGYTVVPNVVESSLINTLLYVSERLLADTSTQHLQRDQFTGSLIPTSKDPAFAQLIGHSGVLDALASLGLGDLRYLSGYVISKPAGSPSLGWHQVLPYPARAYSRRCRPPPPIQPRPYGCVLPRSQDGWFWDDDAAGYGDDAAQVFAMLYLTNTSVHNGCLRVVPGSHRSPHPMHAALRPAHSEAVRSSGVADWASAPEHGPAEGAVDVPVFVGDLVVGDTRVLHGAHPNLSNERRTVITVWYNPRFSQAKRTVGGSAIAEGRERHSIH